MGMKRLIEGMYIGELEPGSNLFGLQGGQFRHKHTRIVHNAGWYNRECKRLGWGDLSDEDFKRISRELKDDELFIIIDEQEFSGHPVRRLHNNEVEIPGIDYAAIHCCYIIAPGQIYCVGCYDCKENYVGILPKIISRDMAKQLIAGHTSPT